MSKNLDDLLRRACASQRLAMERALAEIDITPAQFAAMEWLWEEPGLSGSGDCAKGATDTANQQRHYRQSRAHKGLLARRLQPKRGRAQFLELTPLGREKVTAAAKSVENASPDGPPRAGNPTGAYELVGVADGR